MARTRTPHTNGSAPPTPTRLASAYNLIPDSRRQVGGYSVDKEIDTLLSSNHANADIGWLFYDRIPELRYIARYVANSVKQATLYVGRVTDNPFNPEPVGPRHYSNDILSNWAGGRLGQMDLLDRLGLHLTITGDSILVGPEDGSNPPAPFDRWRVMSTTEIKSRNGRLFYKRPHGADEPLPRGVSAIRIWRSHPRIWWEADSATRSSYSVLREIDLLDQHVHATAISRLAGAGMLGIPDELTLPTDEEETEGTSTEKFIATLIEIMSTAIKDRESAAAVVPIILRGPAEYLSAVKHWDFSTQFDERVPELRAVALRRLALGMDVPPEVLLGMSESNHWSAWQTDESTVRMHTAPLMQTICDSITDGWFRPLLETLPLSARERDEASSLVIWYDLANLSVRPNVTADAQALYDRFEVNGNMLRLTSGVGTESQPDKLELARQILLHLIRTDTEVPYAINALRELDKLEKFLPEHKPPAPPPNLGGRPNEGVGDSDTEGSPSVPGKRSQDKQTETPPPPPADGDGNNNI